MNWNSWRAGLPAIEEAIFHSLNEKRFSDFDSAALTGAGVELNILWDVWHPGNVIEMEMGHKDPFEGSPFRSDRRRSVCVGLPLLSLREVSHDPSGSSDLQQTALKFVGRS